MLQAVKGAFSTGSAYLADDGEDDMMDFLDSRAAQKIRAQLPKKTRDGSGALDGAGPFARTKDGRLFIAEDPDDPRTKLKRGGASAAAAAGAMDTGRDGGAGGESNDDDDDDRNTRTRIGRKRRHNSDEEDNAYDDDDEPLDAHDDGHRSHKTHKTHKTAASVERRSLGGESRKTAMSRRSAAAASQRAGSEGGKSGQQWRTRGGEPAHKKQAGQGGRAVALGSEYRSKKAAGDMRKKDMPAPYAYLPFDARQINKRQTTRAAGDLKSLLKGAKAGIKAARERGSGHRGQRS